jgi:hypothetical protein
VGGGESNIEFHTHTHTHTHTHIDLTLASSYRATKAHIHTQTFRVRMGGKATLGRTKSMWAATVEGTE